MSDVTDPGASDLAALSRMLCRALGMPEETPLPSLVLAMDERDGRALSVDHRHRTHTILSVQDTSTGWYVTVSEGTIHVPNDRMPQPPKPGERMRLYEGRGNDVRGIVIEDRVYRCQSMADYERCGGLVRRQAPLVTPLDDQTHASLRAGFSRSATALESLRSQLHQGAAGCRLERPEALSIVQDCEAMARCVESASACLALRDAFVAGREEGMRVRVRDHREKVSEPSPWPAGPSGDWAAGFQRGWHEADHYKRMQAAEAALKDLAEAVSDLFSAGEARPAGRETSEWLLPDGDQPNLSNPVLAARAKANASILRARALIPGSEPHATEK